MGFYWAKFRAPNGAPRVNVKIRAKPVEFRVPELANPQVENTNQTRKPQI